MKKLHKYWLRFRVIFIIICVVSFSWGIGIKTTHAAIAYVGGNQDIGGSGTPFVTSAYSATAGSAMVIGVFWKGAVTINSVTSAAGTCSDSGAGGIVRPIDGTLQEFVCPNVAGGSNTYSVNFSGAPTGGETDVFKDEYSGVATTNPVDQFSSGTATSGTTATTGNMITTQADEVIHAQGVSNAASGTVTAGTNFTINQFSSVSNGAEGTERRVVAATGTYTAPITFGATITKAVILGITLKAAGGAAASPVATSTSGTMAHMGGDMSLMGGTLVK